MDRLIYTKYSTDRDKKYAMRTDRFINENNEETIRKVALYEEGVHHLKRMAEMSFKLQERYGDKIKVTRSDYNGNAVINEFVKGNALYSRFDDLVEKKDAEGFKDMIGSFKDVVYYSTKELEVFHSTPKFEEVFGRYSILEDAKLLSADVTDIDMIFENIIVSASGQWQLIDYEWTFDFPIPREYMLYRAVWYFYNEAPADNLVPWHEIMDFLEIPREIEECFQKMEHNFQVYIMGGKSTLEKDVAESGNKWIPLSFLIKSEEFYEEGVWYKTNYRVLEKHSKALESELERLRHYKELSDEGIERHNLLKDAYVSSIARMKNAGGDKGSRISGFIRRHI